MAIPQLKEATVIAPNYISLQFDSPLDKTIGVPLSCFTVNYGQYTVLTLVYSSDTIVTISVDSDISYLDDVFISYEPPLNLSLCLRGPVAQGASDAIKKRNSVRAFYRYPVRNTIAPEETEKVLASRNLGQTIGGVGYPYQNRSGQGTDYPSNPKSATPDDFVTAFGLKEAIQLTNMDDPSATTVNEAKLRLAIEDANSLIDSYIEQSGKAGMVLISSNRRRTALTIARYYLDTVRRREDVYKDYEAALKQLSAEREMTAIRAGNGNSAIDTPRGIMRVWAIPQRYNAVSGKGLSGWNTDTGGDRSPDYRTGFGTTGQNNTQNNWISANNYEDLGGYPIAPTDGGGARHPSDNSL